MLLFMLLIQTTATQSKEEGMVVATWDSSQAAGDWGDSEATEKAASVQLFQLVYCQRTETRLILSHHPPLVPGELLIDWLIGLTLDWLGLDSGLWPENSIQSSEQSGD